MNRRFAAVGILATSLLTVAVFVMLLSVLASPAAVGAEVKTEPSIPSNVDDVILFSVNPLRQGRFTSAGETTTFRVPILNNGIVPTDIYELEVSSTWPVALYGPDGVTPLTDTNGNGIDDTGIVNQWQTFDVVVEGLTPLTAVVSDQNQTDIQITSWLSPSTSMTAILQTAVPAPFVQAFRDHANDAMSLFLAEPGQQWLNKETDDDYDATGAAVVETPMGYVYVWSNSRLYNGDWKTEIEYMLVDKSGYPAGPIIRLTDHSTTTLQTHDIRPVVAATPEGYVGLAWHRQVFSDSETINHNIYFASLDKTGSIIYGPSNITMNNGWATTATLNIPTFDFPRIAATGDERFVLAWHQEHNDILGNVRDIYYAVKNWDGSTIFSTTKLTDDLPDESGHTSPMVTGLSRNRVLVTWIERRLIDDDAYYAILDSDGSIFKEPYYLSKDDRVDDWLTLDAAELSGGKILVLWKAWGCTGEEFGRIRLAIIDPGPNYKQYNRVSNPICLEDPGIAVGGDVGVSMAADAENNAIITWTDADPDERQNLYYTLIDDHGRTKTNPMVFHRTEVTPFSMSWEGYAISTRLYIDGNVNFSSSDYFLQEGQVATVTVNYGNLGTLPASSATLTTTFDPGLSYIGTTALEEPTIIDNQLIWSLADLPAQGNQQFQVFLNLSDIGKLGIAYPLTVTLEIMEPDIHLDNNLDRSLVIFGYSSVFLPTISKSQ